MDPIVKEILILLKRKYFKYNAEKFTNVLTVEDFHRVWGREHGGYIPPDTVNMDVAGANTEIYPRVMNISVTTVTNEAKNYKCIYIPGCPWNDKKIFREYIKRGNKILLKDFAGEETINICLTPNFGGKSSVMVMALSPIFNSHRKQLTYCIAGDKKKVALRQTDRGVYSDPLEGKFGIAGSVRSIAPKLINVIMGDTFSAGEVIAIALKSISDKVQVNFIGSRTGGATTNIGWKKLSNGGFIEYPIGYMADCRGNMYPDGVPVDIELVGPPDEIK